MTSTHEVESMLAVLIQANQELNQLLEEDINLFKANDLIAIEQSNQKKKVIQQTIEELLERMDSHPKLRIYPGHPLDKILAYVDDLSGERQSVIKPLIQKAETLWNEGYRLVLTNSEIVDANLNYTKELIGRMTHSTTPALTAVNTYDKSAKISS